MNATKRDVIRTFGDLSTAFWSIDIKTDFVIQFNSLNVRIYTLFLGKGERHAYYLKVLLKISRGELYHGSLGICQSKQEYQSLESMRLFHNDFKFVKKGLSDNTDIVHTRNDEEFNKLVHNNFRDVFTVNPEDFEWKHRSEMLEKEINVRTQTLMPMIERGMKSIIERFIVGKEFSVFHTKVKLSDMHDEILQNLVLTLHTY